MSLNVIRDGLINLYYDKSPNVLELMLESLSFFVKKVTLVKIIKLIFLITKLHSKGLERRHECKKRTLFNIFNMVLALKMKVCHSRNIL
jgi:hypothetical protein